jgi:hypothetical protein
MWNRQQSDQFTMYYYSHNHRQRVLKPGFSRAWNTAEEINVVLGIFMPIRILTSLLHGSRTTTPS